MRVSALPAGTNLARYVMALAGAKNRCEAIYRAESWRDTPGVALALKAAVTAHDSSEPLVQYGIADELFELFRAASIVGRMAPQMRAVPFKARVPAETAAATAGWVAEGGLKPVSAMTLDDLEVEPYRMAVTVALSRELLKMSTPAAEAAVRGALIGAIAQFADSQFLGAAAAVPGTSPAGILSGQQSHNSTGGTAAQIAADLPAMAAKLTTWVYPAWVMKPKTFTHLAALKLVEFLPAGPLLLGFPVILTPASPQQIALIDFGSILLADDGRSEISVFSDGDIQLGNGESPETFRTLSLWQNNLTAIRTERFVSWLAGSSSSAVLMTVNY